MAKVTVEIAGAQPKTVTGATTVADLFSHFPSLKLSDMEVRVNGDVATATTELEDFQFVDFATKVKGA